MDSDEPFQPDEMYGEDSAKSAAEAILNDEYEGLRDDELKEGYLLVHSLAAAAKRELIERGVLVKKGVGFHFEGPVRRQSSQQQLTRKRNAIRKKVDKNMLAAMEFGGALGFVWGIIYPDGVVEGYHEHLQQAWQEFNLGGRASETCATAEMLTQKFEDDSAGLSIADLLADLSRTELNAFVSLLGTFCQPQLSRQGGPPSWWPEGVAFITKSGDLRVEQARLVVPAMLESVVRKYGIAVEPIDPAKRPFALTVVMSYAAGPSAPKAIRSAGWRLKSVLNVLVKKTIDVLRGELQESGEEHGGNAPRPSTAPQRRGSVHRRKADDIPEEEMRFECGKCGLKKYKARSGLSAHYSKCRGKLEEGGAAESGGRSRGDGGPQSTPSGSEASPRQSSEIPPPETDGNSLGGQEPRGQPNAAPPGQPCNVEAHAQSQPEHQSGRVSTGGMESGGQSNGAPTGQPSGVEVPAQSHEHPPEHQSASPSGGGKPDDLSGHHTPQGQSSGAEARTPSHDTPRDQQSGVPFVVAESGEQSNEPPLRPNGGEARSHSRVNPQEREIGVPIVNEKSGGQSNEASVGQSSGSLFPGGPPGQSNVSPSAQPCSVFFDRGSPRQHTEPSPQHPIAVPASSQGLAEQFNAQLPGQSSSIPAGGGSSPFTTDPPKAPPSSLRPSNFLATGRPDSASLGQFCPHTVLPDGVLFETSERLDGAPSKESPATPFPHSDRVTLDKQPCHPLPEQTNPSLGANSTSHVASSTDELGRQPDFPSGGPSNGAFPGRQPDRTPLTVPDDPPVAFQSGGPPDGPPKAPASSQPDGFPFPPLSNALPGGQQSTGPRTMPSAPAPASLRGEAPFVQPTATPPEPQSDTCVTAQPTFPRKPRSESVSKRLPTGAKTRQLENPLANLLPEDPQPEQGQGRCTAGKCVVQGQIPQSDRQKVLSARFTCHTCGICGKYMHNICYWTLFNIPLAKQDSTVFCEKHGNPGLHRAADFRPRLRTRSAPESGLETNGRATKKGRIVLRPIRLNI